VQRYSIRNGKPVEISLEHNLTEATAMLDRTHFTNAIHNLVDNAIKYSYDSVRIAIRCTGEDGWLRISVSDNGIGIPKAYQHSIFEQFFRVPQGDLHNVKGFGLGLAYVKKIVEKHGGRISVKSEPKHGSEFTIAIPQA
jgi:two-component system, OmpR family, phosphate regulon sensor histidine kinase PhoR